MPNASALPSCCLFYAVRAAGERNNVGPAAWIQQKKRMVVLALPANDHIPLRRAATFLAYQPLLNQ